MGSFFHCHTHSEYSCLDGMPSVESIVQRVVKLGQPAIALTDHGNMSGALSLYKHSRKMGVVPLPGIEGYLVSSHLDKNAHRFHVGLIALSLRGYQAISALSTLSHQRDHYHFKPRFGLNELLNLGKEAGKEVALLTGCFGGLIIQTLINSGIEPTMAYLEKLRKSFPFLFIEIQHHKAEHAEGWSDEKIALYLKYIADELSLPVIITQDSHYLLPSEKPIHTMMKNLIMHSGGTEGDLGFNGDSYHLASEEWMRKHYTKPGLNAIWEAAQDSYDLILDEADVKMPALDNYKFQVPTYSRMPDEVLKRRVRSGMEKFGLDSWAHYDQRMKYELGLIADMKMSDYFLLMADLCKWCQDEGILIEARGSANGSLICYVLGITQIDPIEWNLSFDRFLHPTRKKPPDIDLDIDRDRRQEVIDYLSKNNEVAPIGTYGRLGLDEFGKGSVFVRYFSYLRRILNKEDFAAKYGHIKSLWELEEIEPEICSILRRLSTKRVRTSPGTHAAGIVLSSEKQKISDYVPTMLIPSSQTTVTQITMDDLEEAGYMKVDILGSATITLIQKILKLIGKNSLDLTWIPLDDKETCKTLRSGRPDTGIFQFDGISTARGGKTLGVRNTKDVILCMALYRTALMKSGHTEKYLARRKKQEPITYVHDLFKTVLKETLGVVVFQDQVIEMLRQIGMRHQEVNDLLKAVKQSHDRIVEAAKTFERIKPIFIRLCKKADMNGRDALRAWEQIMDFSEYGFNRAHATGYGLRAYRQAYLKTHHPLEFMAALLETHAGTPKEVFYVREARAMGIRLLPADVSISGIHWTLDTNKKAIRRGLSSIKGIGLACSQEIIEHQPYSSVEDLIKRTNSRKVTGGKSWEKEKTLNGVLLKLKMAGALRSVGLDIDD